MTTRKKAQAAAAGAPRRNLIYLSVQRTNEDEAEEPEPPKQEEEVDDAAAGRGGRRRGSRKQQQAKAESKEEPKVQKRRSRGSRQPMSQAELDACIKLTAELINDNYSFGFRTTLSEEQLREYNSAVSSPIDLATILDNLKKGVYATKKEWQNDVNTVWDNALGYHQSNSVYYVAATVMKRKFAKMVEMMDMTEEEVWLRKVVRQLQKLEEIDCS